MGNEIGNFAYPGFDYAAQQTKIERRKALLQAITQQGMEPLQTNRMAGGYAIPISPFEGLAKLAQTAAGVYGEKGLEKQQTDLATKAQGDYRTALSTALKGSGLEQGEIDSLTAAGSNPMAANLMPFITGIAQQKRQMALLQSWLGGGQGAPAAPSGGAGMPEAGAGTVLAPGMSGAPQGGAGAAPGGGMGNIPVGGRNVLGGAMLGMPGLTELGKLQHSDAQTRGNVQFNADGQAYVVQNDGSPKFLPGIGPRDKGELVDTGNSKQFMNPFTGGPISPPMPQNLTPAQGVELPLKQMDTALAAQQQQFNTGMSMPKLPPLPGAMQQSPIAPQQLPQGARPIPASPAVNGIPQAQGVPQGTPLPIASNSPYPQVGRTTPKQDTELAAKRREEQPKAEFGVQQARGKAANVIAKVDEAINAVGYTTAGAGGKVLGMLPGTSAYDLDKTIDTIRANIGFKELADMRAASPTGGALGAVSEKELKYLESAVSSLTQGQSPTQLRQRLTEIKSHYENWLRTVEQSYEAQYGKASGTPPRPTIGAPVKQNLHWDDMK